MAADTAQPVDLIRRVRLSADARRLAVPMSCSRSRSRCPGSARQQPSSTARCGSSSPTGRCGMRFWFACTETQYVPGPSATGMGSGSRTRTRAVGERLIRARLEQRTRKVVAAVRIEVHVRRSSPGPAPLKYSPRDVDRLMVQVSTPPGTTKSSASSSSYALIEASKFCELEESIPGVVVLVVDRVRGRWSRRWRWRRGRWRWRRWRTWIRKQKRVDSPALVRYAVSLPILKRSTTLWPAAAAGRLTVVVTNPLELPVQAWRPASGLRSCSRSCRRSHPRRSSAGGDDVLEGAAVDRELEHAAVEPAIQIPVLAERQLRGRVAIESSASRDACR